MRPAILNTYCRLLPVVSKDISMLLSLVARKLGRHIPSGGWCQSHGLGVGRSAKRLTVKQHNKRRRHQQGVQKGSLFLVVVFARSLRWVFLRRDEVCTLEKDRGQPFLLKLFGGKSQSFGSPGAGSPATLEGSWCRSRKWCCKWAKQVVWCSWFMKTYCTVDI